jgi:hypothetical protein
MINLKSIFLREEFDANGASFKIPDGIMKYLQIDKKLANADKWKAKIILGNSMQKGQKKGDWDNVGYIWISLDSNVIVPIARADEHHYGDDVMRHYIKKKLIPKEDYYPIWAIEGGNYVYDDDVPRALKAFRKFRIYGGRNVTIQNWRKGDNVRATADTFIKQGGDLKIRKGQIAEDGQKVLDLLKEIEELYGKYRDGVEHGKRTQTVEKKMFSLIYRFIREGLHFSGFFRHLDLDESEVKKYEDRVVKAEGEENVEKAIEAIFAFGGLKNEIHNRLREIVRKSKSDDLSIKWKLEDLRLFFGDLDAMIHALGAI